MSAAYPSRIVGTALLLDLGFDDTGGQAVDDIDERYPGEIAADLITAVTPAPGLDQSCSAQGLKDLGGLVGLDGEFGCDHSDVSHAHRLMRLEVAENGQALL